MIFSLCYTTRRPGSIAQVVDRWRSLADRPQDVEFVVTVDADDHESYKAAKDVPGISIFCQTSLPGDCVKGWNLAAEKSVGKIIIAIADDFFPPRSWDTLLRNVGPQGWEDEEYAVHVDDCFVHDLMTLVIITRTRYNRFGYLLFPGYRSIYSDTDLTERAYLDEVVINAMHLKFEHRHCDNGKREKDALDAVHGSVERYASGKTLFDFRKMRGFPIDMGPVYKRVSNAAGETDISKKYAAYIMAVKDDFCLYEVSKRLYDEGVRCFYYAVPSHYWSEKETPESDIEQVISVARSIQSLPDADVYLEVFDVLKHCAPGRSRIHVETRARNEHLDWIRGKGFYHILVVDGDELWRKGLLLKLDSLVKTQHPFSVSCGMIPAIGLPGYPVEDAKDQVTFYIAGNERFRSCRSPMGVHHSMQFRGVIHFTGVRRTMDEIILKHRESGHYDDSDYAFEDWIKNTLPNVRPGMKNAHMYQKYQIWPVIRRWYRSEITDIPASLYPYLGVSEIDNDPVEAASSVAVTRELPKSMMVRHVQQTASNPVMLVTSHAPRANPKAASRAQRFSLGR